MRRTLLACAAALAALAIAGPATASAQSPIVAACLGAGQGDGSFTPQEINTGSIPGVGLGLGQTACAVVNPDAGSEWLNGFVDQLSQAEPPSEPPSEEDIQAIVDAISNADPSNPLAVLGIADTFCSRSGLSDYCSALLGGALSAPVPLGANVTLDGDGTGNCFTGQQSGTGSMFGSGAFYSLEWTADYASGGNAVGIVSGSATDFFGGGESREVTGIVGPGCGAGAKALVLVLQ